jgi:molecular chaperone GrpE
MADDAPFDPAESSPAATDPRGAAEGAAPDIDELKRDRDETYDRLLRKTAEFDNYRRRIERERREQGDQAVVDLLGQLLSIVDDFDRALTVEAGPEAAAYRKGVELIHAKMNDLLRRYNVRPFDAVGADFDPNMHQAVMHEVSEDHREGEVIGELQKGYMLGDKLLRPAMVKVAKS